MQQGYGAASSEIDCPVLHQENKEASNKLIVSRCILIIPLTLITHYLLYHITHHPQTLAAMTY